MPRPKKPDEMMEEAWKKNPQRRRPPAPKSKHPLGNVPADFDKDEKKVWSEIVKFTPEGVLTAADRMSVEVLCRIMAAFRRREKVSASDMKTLIGLFGRYGMTPADRANIAAPIVEEKQDDDPEAEFV